MTIQQMRATAQNLRQPSTEAAAEFEAKQETMAAELNRLMCERPDVDRLVGEGNRPMMENNSRNFFRFMSSLFRAYDPEVLVETAQWVFRAYRSHGFQIAYWPANIDTAVLVLRGHLSPGAFSQCAPFFDWLIVHIPDFVKSSDETMKGDAREPSHG